MEIVLIRHGESFYNIGHTNNLDSHLTETGIKQVCLTAEWLRNAFDLTGFSAITSPYLRTLQTASIICELNDLPCKVDSQIREFHIHQQKPQLIGGGMRIANRSFMFSNLQWPSNECKEDVAFYLNESKSQFVDRLAKLVYNTREQGYNRLLIITHGACCKVLPELIVGHDSEYVKNIFNTDENLWSGNEDIPNCAITWIKDNEIKFQNKVVYE